VFDAIVLAPIFCQRAVSDLSALRYRPVVADADTMSSD
jgi:hypothetical protein